MGLIKSVLKFSDTCDAYYKKCKSWPGNKTYLLYDDIVDWFILPRVFAVMVAMEVGS